jgi:DNA-binding NarL/FixJ family response regulator
MILGGISGLLRYLPGTCRTGGSSSDYVAEGTINMALHITPAERKALELLATGTGSSEIARLLGAPERELDTHLAALFSRLGVATPTEAITEALRRGLLYTS